MIEQVASNVLTTCAGQLTLHVLESALEVNEKMLLYVHRLMHIMEILRKKETTSREYARFLFG